MKRARHRGAAAAASALAASILVLLAAGAGAQQQGGLFSIEDDEYKELTTRTNSFELGFLWTSLDEFAFGDYTGLEDKGFEVLGNVDFSWRSPIDSDATHYFRALGLNLGLESRFAEIEYGQQGRFGGHYYYQQIPKYKTDTADTIFLGSGGDLLGLPLVWTPGTAANASPLGNSILAFGRQHDIDWERKRFGGGFSWILPENLEFEANHRREYKQGEKLMGMVIGNSGGNPRAVVAPEQLDYITDNFDATLRYTTEDLQLQLKYLGSAFDDEQNSQIWQNPYSAIGGWNPAAGYQPSPPIAACVGVPTCGFGQKGTMPDNWFHQLQASGGYQLPYNTRFTLNTAFGWMTQDDPYLPYTVNGALNVHTPVPQNSLKGIIETTLVDARLNSRPLPGLTLDAGYRYDDRDNDTNTDLFIYVGGDSQDQDTIASSRARYNRPYSLTKHQAHFDATYRLPLRTDLTAGYEWEFTDRDLQEVRETEEQTLNLKLLSRPWSMVNARAHYQRSWKNADNYDFVHPQIVSESLPSLVGFDPTTDWENHPLLRKYYLADRIRDQVTSQISLMPLEELNVSFFANYAHDNYKETTLGLTEMDTLGTGVDLTYVPTDWLSAHAFYTFERYKSDQTGWSFQGNNAANPTRKQDQATDPGRLWAVEDEDKVHTVGAGLDVVVIPDRLTFGAQYLFARAKDEDSIRIGPTLAATDPNFPYPENKTKVHSVSVFAKLRLTTNVSTRVGYLFENYDSKDWAFNGVTPVTLNNVIADGREDPHYHAHVVAFSLIYEFW